MTDNGHQKRIDDIETETGEIKRQIMQLEFQHKKDIVEARRKADETEARIQRGIDHLIRLMGISYEELDLLDEKLQKTGRYLTIPRERSTLS